MVLQGGFGVAHQLELALEDSNRNVRGKAVHALFNIGTAERRKLCFVIY